jgi:GntR family transcriptional repressor for pyruvate dehydrogenase complex
MFILDFVENLLIDTKEILKPGKDFSKRVLNAHKRIYLALLGRNAKKACEEMIRHVQEVERDLIAIQKDKRPDLNLQRLSKKEMS